MMIDIDSWIKHDPDPVTQRELRELKKKADEGDSTAQEELEDRFSGLLEFGTAGLRGEMAGGPHRMNRAVVRKAAAGLVDFLQEQVGRNALIVIGYDARHNSKDFAHDTAAVATAMGARAMIYPHHTPTPLLAWAVRHLNADAGVMVTASHNPPRDNGYKVYLGGRAVAEDGQGVQIVPPYDGLIAEKISQTPEADEIPLATTGWSEIGPEVREAYLERASSLIPYQNESDMKIVITSMHGVGGTTMKEVLNRAGFSNVYEVEAQAQPDPDFPTVSFPNPEEPGALDLAIETARSLKADLLIANDPDADRCSAAIPTAQGWRQLSGDEIGTLIGDQIAKIGALTGGTLASSIVSSRLLKEIAGSHGLPYVATLTGFKWIARVPDLIFGYEEAIGFCVDPDGVRDKDGISAGLYMAYIAASLRSRGKTITDHLDDLATSHGVYLTAPVTIRVSDLSLMPATMAHLRANPPTTLAGSPVTSVEDLSGGSDSLPPTDALVLLNELGDRAVVRPSGTEPKVKCYLEVIEHVSDSLEQARSNASSRMSHLQQDMSAALTLPE